MCVCEGGEEIYKKRKKEKSTPTPGLYHNNVKIFLKKEKMKKGAYIYTHTLIYLYIYI